ncbi:MAG TPA: universal stress protein, partial [Flavisolibacter sp.]|nr:universal stress protein [Flavisolibacter sp.]
MKKIIAAFDSLEFSESTLYYAVYLAKNCKAHLVGVFLDDLLRHSYGLADIAKYEGEGLDQRIHELNDKDKADRDASVDKFEEMCSQAGIRYSIHRDRNVAIQELLHESIYADLLIISA